MFGFVARQNMPTACSGRPSAASSCAGGRRRGRDTDDWGRPPYARSGLGLAPHAGGDAGGAVKGAEHCSGSRRDELRPRSVSTESSASQGRGGGRPITRRGRRAQRRFSCGSIFVEHLAVSWKTEMPNPLGQRTSGRKTVTTTFPGNALERDEEGVVRVFPVSRVSTTGTDHVHDFTQTVKRSLEGACG